MLRGRLWQAGQEVGVAVGVTFAALECVVERGEDLEPPLGLCIVGLHFANALQYLVVGEYAALSPPKLPSEVFEGPNDAAGLQIKRSPMSLRVELSTADIRDGFPGTVRLLFFEGAAEPVDVSVAVHVGRT